MDRSEIARYQNIQLSLLKYFDMVCKNNSWNYYMVFGTLLGAVRHKGFIPWDADIDVAMMRSDYEAFIDYYINNAHPDLFLECWKTDPAHLSPHAILRIKDSHVYYNIKSSSRYAQKYDGIYIDIFPIDAITENNKLLKKQLSQIRTIQRIISLKAAPIYEGTSDLSRVCKKIVSYILTPVSFRFLHRCEDAIMKNNNNKGYTSVSMLTNPEIQKEKEIYPVSCFGNPTLLAFEDEYFFAPSNYIQFVEIRYKDYMKLPPENERWGYLDKIVRKIDYGNSENLIQKCIESVTKK